MQLKKERRGWSIDITIVTTTEPKAEFRGELRLIDASGLTGVNVKRRSLENAVAVLKAESNNGKIFDLELVSTVDRKSIFRMTLDPVAELNSAQSKEIATGPDSSLAGPGF